MFGYINEEERNNAVEGIIRTEWDMFQKVNNIGGRAGCQDDRNTFHIMRYSQYSAWTDELLKSYEKDLEAALNQQRNLVMEKYAYMMEFTAPEYYKQELEPYLPKIDMESMLMIEEITAYLVSCDKEIAEKYPKLSKSGRPIEAGSNNGGFTSVETYAIGEMKTYSKKTLTLYLEYIRVNRAAGKNTALIVQDTMVRLYGYASIEEAEKKMQS
jgi:hypothetical protein